MRDFCAERNITVTAFSTLGSPGSSLDKKTKYIQSLPRLFDHPTVKKIAEAHNRTSAQVLLRHAVQNGIIVLPKSTNPGRIKQNNGIFDFALTEDEMQAMNGLDKGEKGRIFHFFIDKGWELGLCILLVICILLYILDILFLVSELKNIHSIRSRVSWKMKIKSNRIS